jgi:hypothetical protein
MNTALDRYKLRMGTMQKPGPLKRRVEQSPLGGEVGKGIEETYFPRFILFKKIRLNLVYKLLVKISLILKYELKQNGPLA